MPDSACDRKDFRRGRYCSSWDPPFRGIVWSRRTIRDHHQQIKNLHKPLDLRMYPYWKLTFSSNFPNRCLIKNHDLCIAEPIRVVLTGWQIVSYYILESMTQSYLHRYFPILSSIVFFWRTCSSISLDNMSTRIILKELNIFCTWLSILL